MKRLLATLSVLAALAVSAVAAVPAFAGEKSYEYDGAKATVKCVQEGKNAAYTLTVEYNGQTHTYSHTFANATCLI